ncbi:MAG: N-6 DNA methylase, partial [Acidobacteria bacterium]|nr:N-6 DNA methylase [Acidobacteriota bacterium]
MCHSSRCSPTTRGWPISPPGTLPPSEGPDPWRLGPQLEATIEPGRRRATGAWYTPRDVASLVAGWALGACSAPAPVVCDPACGGGAFLLAAAEQLEARGLGRAEIVGRLVAIDIEPDAVRTTALALGEWCGGAAEPLTMVGDALVERWPAAPDVVVGNPPFLSQLGTATARSRSRAHKVVDRLGGAASGYVDDAALFLLAAARAVVPGGSVALVQPESVLATRSAAAVRAELAPMLERVWLGGSGLFDAEVRVCAVVLRRDRTGPALVEGDRWAAVVAAARGVPPVSLDGPALGGHARVTAGFRDEYYGLLPLLRESQPGDAPVVTSGLIDPAACRWGARPARIGKRRWSAPGVPPASLPPWALA